ncbi:glycosyltransferase family 69 protein [Epithele typhae]|uniref:glycosyltransferase family 69 protein n=1 Tax=Epithele typhae TaxID=378194 RepID=UPI002007486E|nr:glycosyltransferase family 69 protein [Epithele typhae]KAH9929084.1 glycosyltransferase family 69 protein [Epithele typhae]
MQPKPKHPLRRIPTWLALTLGVIIGLSVSKMFTSERASVWRGGSAPVLPSSRSPTRQPMTLPTLPQRRRILDLLSHLSPHYTKECTRPAQGMYKEQAEQRYASLIGHQSPNVDGDYVPSSRHFGPDSHKYFFAINLYNSFDVIPDLFATLFRVAAVLGYHNVYVSIYENGSSDQTKALLRIFDALCRSAGLRVTIRTSMRTRGAFNHRIEYLAEVRNAAFVPLHELRDAQNEYFDTIIFMNDILPCVDDLLELIFQSRLNNAGITCAADYMFHEDLGSPVFYDNWSIFQHGPSQERFMQHLPVQVQSCWNGIAILDPAPFYYPPHVRFRMARITENECSASECSLICNDYWESGYGRILMVPRVKLAYDNRVYNIIHPDRRNLTAIRGYVRLGGLPDNPRTDPQDRAWFGPHDRLFTEEETVPFEFKPGPSHVWCWGWDGAGDLDGPDVDPIWERMPNKSTRPDAVKVRHDRSLLYV